MGETDVFDAIRPLLVDAIPKAIGSLSHDGALCVLRVYYYDTHAPCAYLDFRCVTAAQRQQMLEREGRDALCYLWGSGEESGFRPSVSVPSEPLSKDTDDQLSLLFASIYDLLCRDEDEYMQSYRSALQSVALSLNALDWETVCPVTDDFVVVPADGSQHFADEYDDLANSIPERGLELLRERGYRGPGSQWDRRRGFDDGDSRGVATTMEEIEQYALAMSESDRIAYWINQLDKMAAGQDCDVTRINVTAGFPVDRLGEMGNRVVVPLLKLACKWADHSEWDVDDEDTAEETPMAEVMLTLLWKIKELEHGDREVELLLREFLERSVKINAGRSLWGTLPVHCAKCLHTLFDRYPEPKMAGNNALVDPERFLAVPPP